MKPIVPCKVALLVALFFFSILLVVVEAEQISRTDTTHGADASRSSHDELFAMEGDGYRGEGDLVAMDYSPARKKTPIHN
ncbi:hypothetical protein L1049_026510 [Liquidambar formosana]|uniref:Uncharacterized protein n=1 Tax=Liquidambar formosana TaxID=63359 RepID=A0AAP0NDU8_LIQFO